MSRIFLFLAVGLTCLPVMSPRNEANAQEAANSLTGTWKLVVLTYGTDEFAIIAIDQTGDKVSGTVKEAQPSILGQVKDLKLEQVKAENGVLSFALNGQAGASSFQGKLVTKGSSAGKILGTYTFRENVHPARLEKTSAQKLGRMASSKIAQEFSAVAREQDPKARVGKFRDLVKKYAGEPANSNVYKALLATAESAGLAADEVKETAETWLKEAADYGEAWESQVQVSVVNALAKSKAYANYALELAEKTDQKLGESAGLNQKAAMANALATLAKAAGKADLARDAEARAAKYEGLLDEEYHKTVPPFHPETFAGRKDPKTNKVVLMELFTGAQCPPCVAADVGFDALLEAYKPTELIGLQYHLHIPGPDPLTNPDSLARKTYYESDVRGTPSTFFNGKAEAGGGGGMQNAEGKYKQYREIIDKAIEANHDAEIELSATQAGDEITIKVAAKLAKPTPKAGDAKEEGNAPKPRLRLVLTEEAVRYVGSNKLRFHHHVVRSFPGGHEGQDLSAGEGSVTAKINLNDLRKELEAYLDKAGEERPFPNALPEIPLKNLSVVAFVQDDADHKIHHAVTVPVTPLNP